ncbi:Cytidylyltransferase-like, putative [Angomonas deanei]|uniref:Cytidylyltransferase-like, putative n=1 Tax=Angomonas deanei TaxID=59799 RepID=A0A7G2CBA1_9TRYP|nr:Cytidylyltransferase-like, putative [Angomonas deanei]
MQSVMRTLFLTTSSTCEANVKLLNEFLQSVAANNESDLLSVFVDLEGASRRVFLEQASQLYNAALQCSSDITINVIPVLGPSGGSAEPATVTKSFIEKNFTPFYSYVAVGGTFDHLHSGHKLLLTTALLHVTDKLRVGVTGDALLQKKKFANQLQPIEKRKAVVEDFLRRIRKDVELEIDTIADVSGGTDTIKDIKALVVSPETQGSLGIINDLRAKNELPPLEPVLIPFVQSSSGVISSTKIREKIQ